MSYTPKSGVGDRSTSPSRIPVPSSRRRDVSPGRILPAVRASASSASSGTTTPTTKINNGWISDNVDLDIVVPAGRVTRSNAAAAASSNKTPKVKMPPMMTLTSTTSGGRGVASSSSSSNPPTVLSKLQRARSASPFNSDSDGSVSPSPQKIVKKQPPIRSTMNIIQQVQKQKQQMNAKAAAVVEPRSNKGRSGSVQLSTKKSWVERNYPESLQDLFVNTKKVKDVTDWLKGALGITESKPDGVKKPSIAVLTGPCGCGKTATLSLVANELDCEIKEWINPMSLTDFNANRMTKWEVGDEVEGRSQYDIFTTFLFKASTYNTLPFKGRRRYKHKLVLIEDFPNLFYRDHTMFHNLLRHYMEEGLCPLVFIIPDNSSSETSTVRLFPKNLLQELKITTISLNPVAATYMTKFLYGICSKEGITPDDSLIESIVVGCAGDIRCAINTLQFKLMNEDFRSSGSSSKGNFKAPKKAASSKGKGKKVDSGAVEKDESLFLFRALGKILYAKRDRTVIVDNDKDVPRAAKQFIRPNPLEDNVEEFVRRIEGSADTFLSFLQQNYVPFFGHMDDIVSASSLLADSEYILSSWPFDDSGLRSYKEKEAKEEVTLLVAARGLMYSNFHPQPNKWRPLRKPMFGDIRSKLEKSSETVHNLVFENQPILQSYCLENIPYYSKLLRKYPQRWSPEQINFIREVGSLNKRFSNRTGHDSQLTERDIAVDGDELPLVDEASAGKETPVEYKVERKVVTISSTRIEEDSPEDMLIEEYDSD